METIQGKTLAIIKYLTYSDTGYCSGQASYPANMKVLTVAKYENTNVIFF